MLCILSLLAVSGGLFHQVIACRACRHACYCLLCIIEVRLATLSCISILSKTCNNLLVVENVSLGASEECGWPAGACADRKLMQLPVLPSETTPASSGTCQAEQTCEKFCVCIIVMKQVKINLKRKVMVKKSEGPPVMGF